MGRPKAYVDQYGNQVEPDSPNAAVIYDVDDPRVKGLKLSGSKATEGPDSVEDYPTPKPARKR